MLNETENGESYLKRYAERTSLRLSKQKATQTDWTWRFAREAWTYVERSRVLKATIVNFMEISVTSHPFPIHSCESCAPNLFFSVKAASPTFVTLKKSNIYQYFISYFHRTRRFLSSFSPFLLFFSFFLSFFMYDAEAALNRVKRSALVRSSPSLSLSLSLFP